MARPLRILSYPNVAALLISPYEADFESLYRIFQERNWKLQVAQTWRQACPALERNQFAVVVCEARLPDGDWRAVRLHLERLAAAQLIVCSRLADERLWADVLDAGGYDVLATPFRWQETLRMITGAWLQWQIDRRSNGKYEYASTRN